MRRSPQPHRPQLSPAIYWWRRGIALAAVTGIVALLIVRPGCGPDKSDVAPQTIEVPDQTRGDEAPLMYVDDLPVGDPEHVRELLREHVVEAAAEAAPPTEVGPIHCTLNGSEAWIDPETGHISTVEPDAQLVDTYAGRRAGFGSGDTYADSSERAAATVPELPGTFLGDVSPDGRLVLLLCDTEEGPRHVDERPIGGVALWDTTADEGWWLIHPVQSVQDLLGPLFSAHFYDDRYCVTESVNGATNASVSFWDLSELPASRIDRSPWLGIVQDVWPGQRRVIGFSHTLIWPGALDTPTIWRAEDGVTEADSVDECEALLGFAVAPDGRSVCAVRAVQEDEPGDYHYALTIFRGEHRHSIPLRGGALVRASWAPDSSAVVADVYEYGEHRLLLIDASTGSHRELAQSDEPFEPRWLARVE